LHNVMFAVGVMVCCATRTLSHFISDI